MNFHGVPWIRRMGTGLRTAARLTALLAAVLAGLGWTYELSHLGWLLAGVVAGVAFAAVPPMRRGVLAVTLGSVVLAVSSDASFALARNLKLAAVLTSRVAVVAWLLVACGFATASNCFLGIMRDRLAGLRAAAFVVSAGLCLAFLFEATTAVALAAGRRI